MMCSRFEFYASVASYYACNSFVHYVKRALFNGDVDVKYERGDNGVVFYLELLRVEIQRVRGI